MEQFLPFVATKSKKLKSKKLQLLDAVKLINQYLVPCREPEGLLNHIGKRRYTKNANPIKVNIIYLQIIQYIFLI